MKKFKYSLMILVGLGLSACGGKSDSTQNSSEVNYESVNIEADPVQEEETAAVVTEEPATMTSADNSKIDKMLDDYEAMITEYDKYVSQLKSGNVDMQSAMNMASKAESIQRELEGMKSQMSVAQTQRLTKLVSKLSTIAAKAASVKVEDIHSVGGVNIKDLGL